MSAAFLALWNGIDRPEARQEYEAWHGLEHVPERVGLPGFVEGWRYANARTYFTLYHLQSLQALQTPEYADVIAHPTPWSARMRPRLSEFVRRPCECISVQGMGHGVALSTVRGVTRDLVAWQQAAQALAQQALDDGHLLRVTLGFVPADYELDYPVGGERITLLAAGQTTVVCLLEHLSADLCAQGTSHWLQAMHSLWEQVTSEQFQLQNCIPRSALQLPAQGRLAPRTQWMHRYS